ncbi:MAG TPA: sugar transferase [Mycobacteriales bacterium]|nr:sugar transferase [Mycobacteriales bacterium]
MTVLDEAAASPAITRSDLFGVATQAHSHSRQDARRRVCVMTTDAAAAITAAALTAFVNDSFPLQTAMLMPLAWMIGAWSAGAYLNRNLKARILDVRKLGMAAVTIWALAGVVAQFHPIPGSRSMVLFGVPAMVLAVLFARTALLPLARRSSLLAGAPIVVVGSQASVEVFLASSERRKEATQIAAACLTDASTGELTGISIYTLENLANAVRIAGADTVLVLDSTSAQKLREFSWQLERLGVGIAVAPLWQVAPHRVGVRTLGETTLVEVSPPRYYGGRRLLRDLCDRAVAAVGLIVASPLFLIVAVAIVVTSRGPVFYRQERTGFGGQRFRLWKFRTMVAEADKRQRELAAQNTYSEGTLFKIHNDPRVTRVGRLLRRTSLDELPQLINVVFGEMALVGPRPTSARPETMTADYRRRTLVKPGLTGLWQVSGRSNLPWQEAVKLDLHYVENRSVDMDLSILRRTLRAVMARDGAY